MTFEPRLLNHPLNMLSEEEQHSSSKLLCYLLCDLQSCHIYVIILLEYALIWELL